MEYKVKEMYSDGKWKQFIPKLDIEYGGIRYISWRDTIGNDALLSQTNVHIITNDFERIDEYSGRLKISDQGTFDTIGTALYIRLGMLCETINYNRFRESVVLDAKHNTFLYLSNRVRDYRVSTLNLINSMGKDKVAVKFNNSDNKDKKQLFGEWGITYPLPYKSEKFKKEFESHPVIFGGEVMEYEDTSPHLGDYRYPYKWIGESFYNIYTESMPNNGTYCLTEKTILPILCKSIPLGLNSQPTIDGLKRLGFRTDYSHTWRDGFGVGIKRVLGWSEAEAVEYYHSVIEDIEWNYSLLYKIVHGELNDEWFKSIAGGN
jgi:hypothetical protein